MVFTPTTQAKEIHLEMRGQRNQVVENWGQTHRCHPELYFEPESLDQLKQILSLAKNESKKVKVVGNGHSPSDIFCTDDYLVSIKHFKKILEINHTDMTVKVEGGILLSELNKVLHENGLALSVLGSISDITLAGAVSVGTHGTGQLYGALHTFVLELELLCADGQILTLSAKNNDDLFRAACLSLGALGIIVSLKIQCEPAFKLHHVQYGLPLTDVIENIDVHLSSSDHFRFFWFPHTNGCTVFHASRTTRPISKKTSWFWDKLIGYYLLEFLYWLSTFIPSMVPWINKTYYRLQSSRQEFTDLSFNVFNFNCLFKQYVMEWAIPRDKMGLVLHQLKAWTERNFLAAHFPVEVRFVKQDTAFLSPSYGMDTCYINIIMYRPYQKNVAFVQYWNAFQDLMFKAGGRPHWAKDYRLNSQQMREMYPCWMKFSTVREQLDPDRLFFNAYLQRIFTS